MTPATILAFDGIKQPIVEWALDYGITPGIIIGRLERGMCIADAITTPMKVGHAGQRLPIYSKKQTRPSKAMVRKQAAKALRERCTAATVKQSVAASAPNPTQRPKRKRNFRIYTYNGMTLSIADWATVTGLPLGTLRTRIEAKWDVERMLTTPHSGTGPKRKPGVVSNFAPFEGTGAGSTAQETPNITFSGTEACPQ